MAWIWAFLGWMEKDMDTGHGLFLGLRARLFSSLLLLGQLSLYDSFLAGQSEIFTLNGEFYFTCTTNKIWQFILLLCSAQGINTNTNANTHTI